MVAGGSGAPGTRDRRIALTALTLFLTFDLIVFGAFTRLTDSGLGCPDWPGCYGSASPLGAHGDIDAAEAAQPSGPVTSRKAWIEMIHRYLAMTVGVLILALAVGWRWRARRRAGAVARGGPGATLVWVVRAGPVRQVHGDAEAVPGGRHGCTCSAAWCCWRCWWCSTRRCAQRRCA